MTQSRTVLKVSDGFLLFTAGVAIGCLLMAKRCPSAPLKAAVLPVPQADDEGKVSEFEPPHVLRKASGL